MISFVRARAAEDGFGDSPDEGRKARDDHVRVEMSKSHVSVTGGLEDETRPPWTINVPWASEERSSFMTMG